MSKSGGPFHATFRPASRVLGRSSFLTSGVTVADIGGKRLRGGQLWSVASNEIVVRLQAEHNVIHDYTISRDQLPADVPAAVGACVVAEVLAGDSPAEFRIAVVRGAMSVDPRATEGTAKRGVFSPGLV